LTGEERRIGLQHDLSRPKPTDRKSGVPLYLQLAAAIRQRIERGELPEGTLVPSLKILQSEFGVSRITVRQAMGRLEDEGLISRHKGKGTFVLSNGVERHWLHLRTHWESLLRELRLNSPTPIAVENPPPLPPLEPDVTAANDYVFLRSVQSRDDAKDPYAIVSVHLARQVYERDPQKFRTHSILPTLADMKDLIVTRARQTLLISSADPYTAGLLRVPLNTPTAEAHWIVLDDRRVAIYVGQVTYRGDCIKMMIDFL
jgi:GntR family transcriptional regulator